MTAADSAALRFPGPLVVGLFIVSRLLLFADFQIGNEIYRIFARPALEMAHAARQGISVYDYHERRIQQLIDTARREGKQPPPEEMKQVEYPPLALAFLYLPVLTVGAGDESELINPGPMV